MPARRTAPPAKISHADFKAWRAQHFKSYRAAERALGLSKDTIRALETGKTRRGAAYPIPPYIEYMVKGYSAGPVGRPKALDQSKIDQAAQMLAAGASIADVAAATAVSDGTIRAAIKRGALPASRVTMDSRRIIDLAGAQQLLNDGKTVGEVAVRYGVNKNSVYRLLYERRLYRPGREHAQRDAPHPHFDLDEAQRLLDDGASTEAVARRLNVSTTSISHYARRGVLTRKKPRQP